jgi:hypothetical protein
MEFTMSEEPKNKVMKWLDFTPHGLYLVPTKLPSGKTVLVMIGKIKTDVELTGLAELGFQQVGDNTYFATRYSRDKGKISGLLPSKFAEYWPELKVREMSFDEVYRPWEIRAQEKVQLDANTPSLNEQPGSTVLTEPNQPIVTTQTSVKPIKSNLTPVTQSTFLGLNEFNEKVYLGVDGRFVENANGVSEAHNHPSRVLKVVDLLQFNSAAKLDHINNCAKGLFNELVNGTSFGYQD